MANSSIIEWTWNSRSHTSEENLRWAWLRGCEWNGWPSFLSEPVVPFLLLFWPLWQVLVGVLVVNICWMSIRYRVVSAVLAQFGVFFKLLKWPITIMMGAYFIWHGNYPNAVICGL